MECGRIFWEAWVDWHISHGFQIIHEERCYLQIRDGNGNYIKLCYHVDGVRVPGRVAKGDRDPKKLTRFEHRPKLGWGTTTQT
jgi:hypothetical protein